MWVCSLLSLFEFKWLAYYIRLPSKQYGSTEKWNGWFDFWVRSRNACASALVTKSAHELVRSWLLYMYYWRQFVTVSVRGSSNKCLPSTITMGSVKPTSTPFLVFLPRQCIVLLIAISKLLSESFHIWVVSYLVPFLESAVFYAAAIVFKQYHRQDLKYQRARWHPP